MLTNEEILTAIDGMTPLELETLRDAFIAKFRVVVPVLTSAPTPAEPPPVVEEALVLVELTSAGANKLNVIKLVRELTKLGLKEAKELVDGAPSVLARDISKADAATLMQKFTDIGATVLAK